MFKGFRFMFIFNLNVVFTTNCLELAQIRVRYSPGFLQEQDFPGRNLLQRASRTPEELLSWANFPRRMLQRVRSPERSHAGAICSAKNRFFPHVVRSDEIDPRETLLLEECWAKAHTDWWHFKKVFFYENELKIKKKPNPENFKPRIYTMKLSAGHLILVRLSL
jgi:hypothetical protein